MSKNDALALLRLARQRKITQQALASLLSTTAKTISRWERGETRCPQMIVPALQEILRMNQTGQPTTNDFTFIDLFAGIGGIRMGFERAGGTCVYTSEWNDWSKKTYQHNFGEGHPFDGDITKVEAKDIPDHDVLLAGFPCQPFSIAGVSKKNALGRAHGFECTTQGTLFFDIERIIREKRPKAFLLENVKNLKSHDKGNTFRVIMDTLENKLGYKVFARVIDARHFVPQHRERILIVGFRERTDFTWDDLRLPEQGPDISSILHPEDGTERAEGHYTTGPKAKVSPKYTLSARLWQYLQDYAAKHQAAGNGFGFGLVKPGVDHHTRTLSARYYKDGSEILIHRGKGKRPRRLTPRECARLMGFPEDFQIVVSDTQAYRQFGNSVCMPMMEAVAKIMAPRIAYLKAKDEGGEVQHPLMANVA
ncbi:MAG: DNA (cytosine-5-)-methyltransferase [Lysobacteraceae bacterium]